MKKEEIIQGKNYEQELLGSAFNFKSNNKTLESMNIFHKFKYFSKIFFIINGFNVFFKK